MARCRSAAPGHAWSRVAARASRAPPVRVKIRVRSRSRDRIWVWLRVRLLPPRLAEEEYQQVGRPG
eukprot:scaffold11241_cov42-Phaeocystis_antarctica.AAC.2